MKGLKGGLAEDLTEDELPLVGKKGMKELLCCFNNHSIDLCSDCHRGAICREAEKELRRMIETRKE